MELPHAGHITGHVAIKPVAQNLCHRPIAGVALPLDQSARSAPQDPVMIGQRPLAAYVRRPPEELFDLDNDLGEIRNLALEPDSSGMLTAFREMLENWQRETKDPWLYRDGVSVRAIQHHLDNGMAVPDRFDFDIEDP